LQKEPKGVSDIRTCSERTAISPSSFGYVLSISHDIGSESNTRTLIACDYSSLDEQEGAMEPILHLIMVRVRV